MAGNTEDSRSGAAIVPPDLTEVITESIAFSTTALPEVLPVISRA